MSEGIVWGTTGECRWNFRRKILRGHRNIFSVSQMQIEAGLIWMSDA